MSFADSVEAPIEVRGQAFPKLTLRSIGNLAAKYQAAQVAKIKAMLDEQKAPLEKRLQMLAVNAAADYSMEDVQQWAWSIDGSKAVAIQSLVQGGMTVKDAGEKIEDFDAKELRDAALEVCNHPNAPSKQAKAKEQEGEQKKTEGE